VTKWKQTQNEDDQYAGQTVQSADPVCRQFQRRQKTVLISEIQGAGAGMSKEEGIPYDEQTVLWQGNFHIPNNEDGR
jgi:hypothetical protein